MLTHHPSLSGTNNAPRPSWPSLRKLISLLHLRRIRSPLPGRQSALNGAIRHLHGRLHVLKLTYISPGLLRDGRVLRQPYSGQSLPCPPPSNALSPSSILPALRERTPPPANAPSHCVESSPPLGRVVPPPGRSSLPPGCVIPPLGRSRPCHWDGSPCHWDESASGWDGSSPSWG